MAAARNARAFHWSVCHHSKIAAATDAGTESVTAWLAPAAAAKGDAGDVVLPTGRPDREMDTEPVKPFCPVTIH